MTKPTSYRRYGEGYVQMCCAARFWLHGCGGTPQTNVVSDGRHARRQRVDSLSNLGAG
jgi:hypothetical protein